MFSPGGFEGRMRGGRSQHGAAQQATATAACVGLCVRRQGPLLQLFGRVALISGGAAGHLSHDGVALQEHLRLG